MHVRDSAVYQALALVTTRMVKISLHISKFDKKFIEYDKLYKIVAITDGKLTV